MALGRCNDNIIIRKLEGSQFIGKAPCGAISAEPLEIGRAHV